MGPSKRPVGNINRIREFELEKVILADEFDILQIVGEGWFGKILLVEHRATDTEMVLKALPKPYVSLRDFYREFHYGLHLGVHKNIVTTYDVAFETAGFYVFTQEYASLGDLTSNVMDSGIGELHTKRVAKQIASALDFIHSKELVHRDIKLDNVLVFRSDFSRVKLCDFGETRRTNTLVQRRNEWLPYSPPEVLIVNTDESYKTNQIHDIWQFGIVIFVCLTGCLPWQKAALDDPRYNRYLQWHGSSIVNPIKRTPKLFKLISAKACRMFRKYLEPNLSRRATSFVDLSKFLDDKWLAKRAEKDIIVAAEPDELCASMYSFHSSPEEKNKLLSTLAQHGIETTVDRSAKKQRIRDWIQSSVITEEEEEDDSGTTTPSSTHSRTPIAGHVSSLRSSSEQTHKVTSTKDASNKHINPRTGNIEQGPSRMGFDSSQNLQFKEQSPVEHTSKSAYVPSRAENQTNHSFKSKRNNVTNGRSNASPSRAMSEPSGSTQHLTYQPNDETFTVNPIMDSAYGSMDGNSKIRSPVLIRRFSNKVEKHNFSSESNSHSFDSEDGASDERASPSSVKTTPVSMKDTAYDYVRVTK
ncbi:Serine/threonine-protein kinase meng-po [Pseudolycoriella hygida]|uniref:Serine/threonine-protein kinase meng-po n=1 Tax=Pseudolycoriella hygida TaxID=35572 RepID=A0A9Q0N4D1_9DIPT|nr:Serine/threonine-protein kinase meng-po [Pseudolycoriella hygida]